MSNVYDIERICFNALDSVLEPRSSAYVAGPLDTGRLFYETIATDRRPDHKVRQVNQESLTDFARKLRQRLPYPVIDPGVLIIEGGSGQQYGSFFLRVVERYVKEAWFIDGWEYSSGATKEFVYCLERAIPCLDSKGIRLTKPCGCELIMQAVTYIESLGLDATKLRSRVGQCVESQPLGLGNEMLSRKR
jgi:hypothetical protein